MYTARHCSDATPLRWSCCRQSACADASSQACFCAVPTQRGLVWIHKFEKVMQLSRCGSASALFAQAVTAVPERQRLSAGPTVGPRRLRASSCGPRLASGPQLCTQDGWSACAMAPGAEKNAALRKAKAPHASENTPSWQPCPAPDGDDDDESRRALGVAHRVRGPDSLANGSRR